MKGLWSMFAVLCLSDRILQRGWKEPAKGEMLWQVFVPKVLRETVIQGVYGAPGSGHFRVNKTLHHLRQGFYWGQHMHDVQDYYQMCDESTTQKGPTGTSQAQLQQFSTGYPMDRVGIDILRPFPHTEKGNRYVLTAMDYFTKWPKAYSVLNWEAEPIVEALLGGCLADLGRLK